MASCPGPAALLAIALGEDDTEAIAAHVECCADCAGFIADVIAYPDIEPEDGTTAPSEDEIAVDRDALRLKTSGGHLTPRLLVAYYEGQLASVSEELVLEHLTTCQQCGDAVVDLTERGTKTSWADFLARHGAELGFSGEDATPPSKE